MKGNKFYLDLENKINFDVVCKNWLKFMSYGISYDAVCATLKECKLFNTELTVRFTNNKEIKKLNKLWRKKNIPTNVLSFPNKNNVNILKTFNYIGDIVVSYDKIIEESIKYNISFGNHVIHLIIHGILHLAGYDHENVKGEKKMISIEEKIMKEIGISACGFELNMKYGERS
tara:strand:- start:21786 stop:22304 length:519 start_codon:yes stop_codon:yes gene_type:complete